MLPCPDCNNPLTDFPIADSSVHLYACDGCQAIFTHRSGSELNRINNVMFDDLVQAYGTEHPRRATVDFNNLDLPQVVVDALKSEP